MLLRKTALILGAGASKDFGLPLGIDLRDQLSADLRITMDDWGNQLTSGNYHIFNALKLRAQADDNPQGWFNLHIRAASEVSEAVAMCSSIDDCLERHAGNKAFELCGKLAIAQAILSAERDSSLRIDPRNGEKPDLSPYSRHWATEFLRLATRGIHLRDLHKAFENLIVISFNYDRTFEYFVYHWLIKAYTIEPIDAQNLVMAMKIYHPYGSLGNIFNIVSKKYIPFGGEMSHGRILDISNNINTYSESLDSDSLITAALSDCKTIITLGFAFHRQNFDLLRCIPPKEYFSRFVFSTTVGISDAKWDVIRSRLSDVLVCPENVLWMQRHNLSCEGLLAEFGDNIAD